MMSFEPAVSLTEQIADHIGNRIITGQLQPLQRIQELKVAADLGVSRGSVREALLILERRYLVEIIPRRGAMVSRMEEPEIQDLGELFTELEIRFFVKLAKSSDSSSDISSDSSSDISSDSSSDIDLSQCCSVLEDMAKAVAGSDLDGLLATRKRFFDAVFDASSRLPHHYYLATVLAGLVPAGLRLAYLVSRREDFDARDVLRYHQALTAALAAHDAERVKELVAAFSARELRLAMSTNAPGHAGMLTDQPKSPTTPADVLPNHRKSA